MVVWVHWSYPQGTQRSLKGHHSIFVILLKQLLLSRWDDGTQLASTALYVLFQSRQTCRAFHIWRVQVLENSTPHISLYTCLKPSGRCTLAWKTYSFSHFSVFSSSVGKRKEKKRKRRLLGKNVASSKSATVIKRNSLINIHVSNLIRSIMPSSWDWMPTSAICFVSGFFLASLSASSLYYSCSFPQKLFCSTVTFRSTIAHEDG